MKRKPTFAIINEVSSGTLRDEDLIETFANELRYNMRRLRLTRDQRKRFGELVRDCEAADFSNDCADHGVLIEALFDALGEIAPPYAYFGALEGDGACFGFWPIVDDDELPKYPGITDAAASREAHDCYIISDHGNVTCGHITARGVFREYWSVV